MAFAVSGGELVTATVDPVASAYSLPPRMDSTGEGLLGDYAAIWRTQPQVRTVCSFLGRNIAQLGLHLFRRKSDVDRERVTDHPVTELLGRPTPQTTPYRMVDALVQDMAIYDRAGLGKVLIPDGSRALLRLAPERLAVHRRSEWLIETFRYYGVRNRFVEFDAAQVVYFHGYNPRDATTGLSPMETLRQLLLEEYEGTQARRQVWRNGARIQGYLERPADAPKWSDPARERFRRSWRDQYTGQGSDAGGTPILEDGMKFVPANITAKDAQYAEVRKLTREEVASAFHIPPPMVGILDHATFSNIKEQHKQLYMDCLGPWLTMIVQEFQLQLLPDFEDLADAYLEFNLASKLAGSFEEQASQLQTAVGGPWMSRNEARARVNLPQVDGADELIVPLNVITGGQASPTDSAPESSDVAKARSAIAHLQEGLLTCA
jgi:HK97 family phage portal protein